ncbi:spore germination protein KB [Cohnella sp. OV330]|uniref:GerAB/ArcD/ProY family transporter n=1 Tax=Cohnella sp. OV330 TaxID=1855288 RepID=UPI0008E13C67|nr:endospore germination permease [Cohnella sp. OV330]SFB09845.1 spore germination protein KB [Cohnella sp. OV330]
MIEKGKINARQFSILTLLFSLGSAILIVPSALTAAAMQDGWISAIVGVAAGIPLLAFYNALGSRHPDLTLIEYTERLLGKWVGKIVGLLFFSFFLLLSALVLRNVGDFITTIVMPETPIESVHFILLIAIAMGVGLGLEVIARSAEIFLPWVLMLLFFLIVFLFPQIEMDRIQPVFESGVKTIVRGSLSVISIPYLELVVFLMIYPYVGKPDRRGAAMIKGALIGGTVLVLITMLCVFVLGWDFTSRHTFPSYTLAKKIQVGEFLQRIEVLVAIIWFLTIFFKLVLCFYASLLGLAQLLKMNSYRPLIVPCAMIVLMVSIVVYPNIVYFRIFASEIWPFYALTTGFLLPLLVWAASLISSTGDTASKSRPPA